MPESRGEIERALRLEEDSERRAVLLTRLQRLGDTDLLLAFELRSRIQNRLRRLEARVGAPRELPLSSVVVTLRLLARGLEERSRTRTVKALSRCSFAREVLYASHELKGAVLLAVIRQEDFWIGMEMSRVIANPGWVWKKLSPWKQDFRSKASIERFENKLLDWTQYKRLIRDRASVLRRWIELEDLGFCAATWRRGMERLQKR